MYEELVDEFEFKKSATSVLEAKDQRIALLSVEVTKLKTELNQSLQYVTGFKRELGKLNVVLVKFSSRSSPLHFSPEPRSSP
jgi:hypothetical protein